MSRGVTGPRVSVLVIARDAAATLPRALVSLLGQTFEDWECVLVDDASTDATAELARRLVGGRGAVLSLPRHAGRGAARAAGLARCGGQLLAFLDADDWMYPERLELAVAALERDPGAVAAFSPAVVEGRGRVLGVLDPSDGRYPPWPFATCVARSAAAGRVGFGPALRHAEDLDFLLRLLEGQRWLALPTAAYAYRVGEPDVARHRATQLEAGRVLARRALGGSGRALAAAGGALARRAVVGWLPSPVARRVLEASRQRRLRGARPREITRHRAERARLERRLESEGWPSGAGG